MRALVLDTNVVLDLFVFLDPRVETLAAELRDGTADWIATPSMRGELECVLRYPNLTRRADPLAVLRAFDEGARVVIDPPPSLIRCTDGDDQKFIDLALAHQARLLSKDKAVLKLRKRMAREGVDCSRPGGFA